MKASMGRFTAWVALGASLAIGACSKSSGGGAPAGPGEIAVRVDSDGFTPSEVKAEKGKPLTLVFTRTTDATCAKEVVFPELDIEKPLPKDTPVRVQLPTTDARSYTLQCGMAMYKGKVVVQ